MVRDFGRPLKISYTEAPPQENLRPRFILNLLKKTDELTTCADEKNDRNYMPSYFKFCCYFSCILLKLWELEHVQGPVHLSKLDITNMHHQGTLRLSQVGDFYYISPLGTADKITIICIGLILLLGWLNSLKQFFAFSDTMTYVFTYLIDMPPPSRFTGKFPISQIQVQDCCTHLKSSPILTDIRMKLSGMRNTVPRYSVNYFMALSKGQVDLPLSAQ